MEEKGQDGAATPSMEQRIGDVQRQDLLATALREVAAISIHTNMNVEGQPKNFHCQAMQWAESAAGSSAGGGAAAASPMFSSSGTNLGRTYVSTAGAAQFTAKASAGAASARGGRNTELKSKGRHAGNSIRLEPDIVIN